MAVVAPQIRLHAGASSRDDRLGDQVEFLPAAVHAPGSVQPFSVTTGLYGGPLGGLQEEAVLRA
jgi:hypothetical protein